MAKAAPNKITHKKPNSLSLPGNPPTFIPQIPLIKAGIQMIRAIESRYFIKLFKWLSIIAEKRPLIDSKRSR